MPNFLIVSLIILPISSDSDEITATWVSSSSLFTGIAIDLRYSTAIFDALLMPFLIPTEQTLLLFKNFLYQGIVICFNPSLKIDWAIITDVVRPSPAPLLVFSATSFTTLAPIFWIGSFITISRLMEPLSLAIVGPPYPRSNITFLPFGPIVTLATSPTVLTPLPNSFLALFLNKICLLIYY